MTLPIVIGATAGGPSYEIVDVTPGLAKEWLDHNTHNRNIREQVVDGYAVDMAAGHWPENGQSIKFSVTGVLLDGQHRLAAIVKSGVTLRMLVVRNLPDETQMTMDTGAKRTFADVLRLNGESYVVPLAAVCLRVYQWKQGVRKSLKGGTRPTHIQLLTILEDHPELRRSVEVGKRVTVTGALSAGTASLCHWLFNRINTSDCAFFYARLYDGAGLPQGDPIYALRRALDNLAKGAGRPDEAHVTALVIKAWNLYRAGSEINVLLFKAGGANPEQYPEPK
jgi:hypothetical protein